MDPKRQSREHALIGKLFYKTPRDMGFSAAPWSYFFMADTTYDLFFTGRDDPRKCVIIGEDTKPIYLCFETPERGLLFNTRTMVCPSVAPDALLRLYVL